MADRTEGTPARSGQMQTVPPAPKFVLMTRDGQEVDMFPAKPPSRQACEPTVRGRRADPAVHGAGAASMKFEPRYGAGKEDQRVNANCIQAPRHLGADPLGGAARQCSADAVGVT